MVRFRQGCLIVASGFANFHFLDYGMLEEVKAYQSTNFLVYETCKLALNKGRTQDIRLPLQTAEHNAVDPSVYFHTRRAWSPATGLSI